MSPDFRPHNPEFWRIRLRRGGTTEFENALTGQRQFEVAVASSRSAFATHLRLEAAATRCLREPQNPALSFESGNFQLIRTLAPNLSRAETHVFLRLVALG